MVGNALSAGDRVLPRKNSSHLCVVAQCMARSDCFGACEIDSMQCMKTIDEHRRRGVTLVEFLIVLAIVGGLLVLLLPAVQAARERAREATCKNNLHQINVALGHFATAYKQIPKPSTADQVGGWTIEILPFIEQQALYDRVTIGTPLATAPSALRARPAIFTCPVRHIQDAANADAIEPAHYVLIADSDRESLLVYDAPISLQSPWASGPEMTYDAMASAIGPHRGGFFFVRGSQQGVDFQPGTEANAR